MLGSEATTCDDVSNTRGLTVTQTAAAEGGNCVECFTSSLSPQPNTTHSYTTTPTLLPCKTSSFSPNTTHSSTTTPTHPTSHCNTVPLSPNTPTQHTPPPLHPLTHPLQHIPPHLTHLPPFPPLQHEGRGGNERQTQAYQSKLYLTRQHRQTDCSR
ncbi:hypothetical protein Pmani_036071 [Petrolisthes manimaculis]|uniref:Uncharacterized protein n=1 Tax=Petrolisthes manimaculis TaxID=1843537 RepID=A0AAE1TMR1_9EUCA|nr:hypothetical protein Pmani_036071 [Petrolisthes manimaculis]